MVRPPAAPAHPPADGGPPAPGDRAAVSRRTSCAFSSAGTTSTPTRSSRGPAGVAQLVSLLEGYEAPAAAWEAELFPARMRQYVGEWLEHACYRGEVAWGRLSQREPLGGGPRRGLAVTEPSPSPRRAPREPGRVLTFAKRNDLGWSARGRPGVVRLG